LFTNDVRRFTLLPAATYTIGGFANQVKDGCLLHSPKVDQFYALGGPGPFSIQHVAAIDDNAEQQYYRPWMHVGTTYTGNKDQGYVGQKAGAEVGTTDMVLHFGGPTEGGQKNHLRAIYTDGYTSGTNSGAHSEEGLEFFRLWPRSPSDPHFGIGDFYAGNLIDPVNIIDPTERLDVLDGRVRIRKLPDEPQATTPYKVMVVDATAAPSAERGVVKWVDPSVFIDPDCDWTLENEGVSGPLIEHDVYTATGSSDDCPDATDLVGIGTVTPDFKLDVEHTAGTSGSLGGIRSLYWAPSTGGAGIWNELRPENGTNMAYGNGLRSAVFGVSTSGTGVWGSLDVNWPQAAVSQGMGVYGNLNATAGTTTWGWGARGLVSVGSAATVTYAYGTSGVTAVTGMASSAYGLFGESKHFGTVGASYGGYVNSTWFNNAIITSSFGPRAASGPVSGQTTTVTNSYGLYASALGGSAGNYSVYGKLPTGSGVNWSGFFEGAISAAGVSFPSDVNLKTGIEDLDSPMDLLQQLQPKMYEYRCDEYPQMGLPGGQWYGFIAQEVQQVFPQFVTPSHQPAHVDSLGNEVDPAVDYLALSTTDIIPILVAAVQEEHAAREALNDSLAAVRQQLDEQAVRLDQLESLITDCCERSQPRNAPTGGAGTTIETDLRIIPNPVADRTELRYSVGTEGTVRLSITAPDGRTVLVRDEGMRATGTYSYGWDTTAMAPGTYHCTLYVNEELVVRKAVKVAGR